MDNLQPVTDVDPSVLPEGFTTGGASSPSATDPQKPAAEEQKQSILEQALTPDALARLRRIKLVKADKATAVENAIASMALSGKLPGPISEAKLIEMLERRGATEDKSSSSSISFQRKKYAMDSDSEDDNDDDLM